MFWLAVLVAVVGYVQAVVAVVGSVREPVWLLRLGSLTPSQLALVVLVARLHPVLETAAQVTIPSSQLSLQPAAVTVAAVQMLRVVTAAQAAAVQIAQAPVFRAVAVTLRL